MATTRKTTAKPAAPEYDFDNWSEDDEQKAIAAIAPEVKYVIVERTFVGRFFDGTIVKASLALTLDDVDALQAEHDNEIDQFRALIRVVGGDENVRELSRQDISDVTALAVKYFDILEKVQKSTRPE